MSVLPALMLRSLAFVILTGALALGVALGGCGGGEDSASTSAASSQSAVAQAPQGTAGQETQAQGQEGGSAEGGQDSEGAAGPRPQSQSQSSGESPAIHSAPGTPGHPTPGTKAPAAGVPVTSGGDNSVQTFGEEGDEDERQQAEANLRSYLNARAEGNWAAACAAASKQFSEELEKLIEQAKAKPGAEKPEGCAETLELLLSKTPASTLQQAAQVEQVLSFRIRDDGYAYLIYKAPEGEIKFIAMANDNGTWKVNVPEPASFQASQGESQ